MPSQIIQSYLNDESVDLSKRQKMFQILKEKPQDEAVLERVLQDKYGKKYAPQKPAAPRAAAAAPEGFGAKVARSMRHAGDITTEATATGFEGLGGVGEFAGKVGEYVDPIGYIGRAFDPEFRGPLEFVGKGFGEFAGEQARTMRERLLSEEAKRGESTARDIGRVLGQTATLIPSILGGVGATQRLAQAPQLAGRAGQLGALLGGGGVATTGAAITEEGRLPTPGELGIGAAIDVGTLGLGKILGGLGRGAFRKLVPTTPTQRAADIKRGFDLGEEMAKIAPITSSEQRIVSAAQKRVGELSDELIENIKQSDVGAKYTIDNFLEGVRDKALKSRNLKATPREMPRVQQQIDEALEGYRGTLGGEKMSLEQIHSLKQSMGQDLSKDINRMIRQGVEADVRAPRIVDLEIQKTIKNALEKAVPRYKELNKQMSPLITSYKRIAEKGPYSGYLTDLLAGGIIGGTGGDVFADPLGFAQRALLGIAGKRFATSPLGKTIGGRLGVGAERALQAPVTRGLPRGLMFSGRERELEQR